MGRGSNKRRTGWWCLAALALTLAACTSDESAVYPEAPQPKAKISPVTAVQKVGLPDRNGTFSTRDHDKAGAFLDAYRDGARGPLTVTVTAPNTAAAEKASAALSALARRRGVAEDALDVTTATSGVPGIALRYTDYVAVPPECNPELVLSRNPTGEVSPNLGCALERGLTAMLAHPADYQAPSEETSADGAHGTRVLTQYRQGKSTQSEVNRNDDVKASTIAVNK